MAKIVVNDWMTSMGAVALLRLDSEEKIIQCEANSLEIPLTWFERLPSRLFQYFLTQYSVADREYEILKNLVQGSVKRSGDTTKYRESMRWINNRAKETVDKIKRDFPEMNDECQQISQGLKEGLAEKEFDKVEKCIAKLYKVFKREDVNRRLTLNWVKAMLLQPAAGQASFLNVSKNKLNFNQQMELFGQDYVAPTIWELKLRQLFNEGKEDEFDKHFESDEKPAYAAKWQREQKKSKLGWMEWLQELPECPLLEGQWGTIPFEEMHFVPLGMSISNSRNYAWNGDAETMQSISSLARLVLLLSPLGTHNYRRPYKGEQVTVFGFLHFESSCMTTLDLNNQLANSMNRNVKFSEALRDSFSRLKEVESKRRSAAMLIEWDTDARAKKTLLEYRALNADFIEYLLSEKSSITSRIYPFDFREEVVRAALDNIDSKHIIIKEMRSVLDVAESRRHTGALRNALLMREYLLRIKGEESMSAEETITNQMYKLGYYISKRLGDSRQGNEDGSYQAPGEKKLTAVAYRLMNAAKAGNRQLFFDTAARLHIAAGASISSKFVKALDSTTTDKEFTTIALAFVAGLIPSDKSNEEKSQ